ncbi:MAG: type IV secretion protein Dot [Legionella sp.]|nr:type IV secretion protein Dot [Legionella sp.]
MRHEFINESVDIYKFPQVDKKHVGATEVTIGDLHANSMNLMFMLVKHGIATNINENEYNELAKIYKTKVNDLTRKDKDRFDTILSKIKFNNNCLIRLIGDELADRGQNDYFILKLLEKLDEHKVPVEILISNHSIEFIETTEKQNDFDESMLHQGGHATSMMNLQTLVDKKIVTKEEILDIANESYKPSLRAISYSLSEDQKEITIYSHAGIGLNTIKSLAQKLNLEYKDATASDLAQTIDAINVPFQIHVQNNTINTLYSRDKMREAYVNSKCDLSDAPFEFIMWNRRYDEIDRPVEQYGYKLMFVHGHDSDDPLKNKNSYTLDSNLGKSVGLNSGDYKVLYTQKKKMAHVNKPEEIEYSDSRIDHKIHPTSGSSSKSQQYFLSQLKEIWTKREDLILKDHSRAASSAKQLYTTINKLYENLSSGAINIQIFKEQSTQSINKHRPELEKHRGWKQLLGNLALAVAGMGVLYCVAGLINKAATGRFLFFKTDSAKKIEQLERSIKSMTQPI